MHFTYSFKKCNLTDKISLLKKNLKKIQIYDITSNHDVISIMREMI